MKILIKNLLPAIGGFIFFASWIITNHHVPWNTSHQELVALAGMFLFFPWKNIPNISNNLKFLIFVWCSTLTIQYFLHKIYFGDFIFGVGLIFVFFMAYCCGKQKINENSSVKNNIETIIYSALLAAALANSIVGLSQWLGVSASIFSLPSPTWRVYGNMAQPNQLATLLLFGIISLIYFDTKKQIQIVWLLLAASILSFTLAATESRTGALSFTVLIGLILFLRKNSKIFLALRWLIPAFIVFWVTYANWSALSIGVSRSGVYFSSSGRFELWEQMIIAIQMKPWLGWGWLNLGEAQYSVIGASSEQIKINIDHAHNIFIDFLVWFGIPIGITLIAVIIKFTVNALLYIKKNPKDFSTYIAYLMLIPIGIHSLLEYPFAYLYFLIPIGIFIGKIEKSTNLETRESLTEKKAAFAIAISTVVFSAIIIVNYFQIEKDFFAARLEKEFFTSEQNLHKHENELNLLTQYKKLLYLTKSDEINPAEISEARKITMRFPWLSNYKQYYVELLRNKECKKANSHMKIIEKLFGDFGVAKTKEAAIYAGLSNICTENNKNN